jgi:hypothetical protein
MKITIQQSITLLHAPDLAPLQGVEPVFGHGGWASRMKNCLVSNNLLEIFLYHITLQYIQVVNSGYITNLDP